MKLGSYRAPIPPPGAVVALRQMTIDARSMPLYGERIAYVVVAGVLRQQLYQLVCSPSEFIAARGRYALSFRYYIVNHLTPVLKRVLDLAIVNPQQRAILFGVISSFASQCAVVSNVPLPIGAGLVDYGFHAPNIANFFGEPVRNSNFDPEQNQRTLRLIRDPALPLPLLNMHFSSQNYRSAMEQAVGGWTSYYSNANRFKGSIANRKHQQSTIPQFFSNTMRACQVCSLCFTAEVMFPRQTICLSCSRRMPAHDIAFSVLMRTRCIEQAWVTAYQQCATYTQGCRIIFQCTSIDCPVFHTRHQVLQKLLSAINCDW